MSTDARIEELKRKYLASLAVKAVEIERQWSAVRSSRYSSVAVSALADYLHRLAGSTGMYGYTELSERVQTLEARLTTPVALDPLWRTDVAERVQGLLDALNELSRGPR